MQLASHNHHFIDAAHRFHHVAQLGLYNTRHRFVVTDKASHDPHRGKRACKVWVCAEQLGWIRAPAWSGSTGAVGGDSVDDIVARTTSM